MRWKQDKESKDKIAPGAEGRAILGRRYPLVACKGRICLGRFFACASFCVMRPLF